MLKDQVLIPLISQTWASGGRPTGRPSQKSVDRAVNRCVEATCTSLAWGPVDRSREFTLWIWPRPTERSTAREQCSLVLTSVDRPVDW